MTLRSYDLTTITARTLAYYNQYAEDFRDGTSTHDVSQNIGALLRHIVGTPPFTRPMMGVVMGHAEKAPAGNPDVALLAVGRLP